MYNANGVSDCRELLEISSKDRFPKLKDCALKMYSMYGNTYMCNSIFFTLKQVKSENRNLLTDNTLGDNLAPLTLVLIKERYCHRSLDHRHPTYKDLQ